MGEGVGRGGRERDGRGRGRGDKRRTDVLTRVEGGTGELCLRAGRLSRSIGELRSLSRGVQGIVAGAQVALALRGGVLEQRGDTREGSTERVGEVTDEAASDREGNELGESVLSEDSILDGAESLESVSRYAGRLVVETAGRCGVSLRTSTSSAMV